MLRSHILVFLVEKSCHAKAAVSSTHKCLFLFHIAFQWVINKPTHCNADGLLSFFVIWK